MNRKTEAQGSALTRRMALAGIGLGAVGAVRAVEALGAEAEAEPKGLNVQSSAQPARSWAAVPAEERLAFTPGKVLVFELSQPTRPFPLKTNGVTYFTATEARVVFVAYTAGGQDQVVIHTSGRLQPVDARLQTWAANVTLFVRQVATTAGVLNLVSVPSQWPLQGSIVVPPGHPTPPDPTVLGKPWDWVSGTQVPTGQLARDLFAAIQNNDLQWTPEDDLAIRITAHSPAQLDSQYLVWLMRAP